MVNDGVTAFLYNDILDAINFWGFVGDKFLNGILYVVMGESVSGSKGFGVGSVWDGGIVWWWWVLRFHFLMPTITGQTLLFL